MTPLQIAVYISGHGYGHYTRTINLLEILSQTGRYKFHIRTTTPLQPDHLKYALHPAVIQTSPYQIDSEKSLQSLEDFDSPFAEAKETQFLKDHNIQAVFIDALPLPCLLAHSVGIPAVLITNFTFDSIFQKILDEAPESLKRAARQLKISEMIEQYALASAVIRSPGYIPFLFTGPKIIDSPMHSRKAKKNRRETLDELGLLSLHDKKILLHSFGGHSVGASSELPKLPDGWVCLSQNIDSPPFFYQIPSNLYLPDIIAASDCIIGKLGWGTCSEVIGNGYKPFVYVPRSAFMEEVGLLRWMQSDHRRLVRLEVEKYESWDWQDAIEEAYKMPLENPKSEADWAKYDEELVRIVDETLASALAEIS